MANAELGNISLSTEEGGFLKDRCPYLKSAYLTYLAGFRFRPAEQVILSYTTAADPNFVNLHITIRGRWVDTILYEIPLLALTSEAYFKFCNKDWDHNGQEEKAYKKGMTLFEHGCLVSEFGSRRRRDYKTHDLVMHGLIRAANDARAAGFSGKLAGSSNVHFAMKYGVEPVGTVAHEWYMGIAALTDNYENANAMALSYWMACFGEGVRTTISILRPLLTMTGPWYRVNGYIRHFRIFPCFQGTWTPDLNSIARSSSNHTFRPHQYHLCSHQQSHHNEAAYGSSSRRQSRPMSNQIIC